MMGTAAASPAYMILTSKPGIYRSEVDADAEIVETYDYVFYGKTKAIFQVARLIRPTKVRIIEDAPPHVVNHVPTRVIEQFPSLEEARQAVVQLAGFGTLDAVLVKRG